MAGYNNRAAIKYGWDAQGWLLDELKVRGYRVEAPDKKDPFSPIDLYFPGALRPITVAVKGTKNPAHRLLRRRTERDHWCDLYVLVTPRAAGGNDCHVKGWTWGTVYATFGFWDPGLESPAWVLATQHLTRGDLFQWLVKVRVGQVDVPARPSVPYPPTPYVATPRSAARPVRLSPQPDDVEPRSEAPSPSGSRPHGDGPPLLPRAAPPSTAAARDLEFGRDVDPLTEGDPIAAVEAKRAGWRKASHLYYLRKHVDQEGLW